MRKKSLAISNIVMLVAAVFCIAVFGAGAVWAYNANLSMKLPAEFTFSACTLTYSSGKSGAVYSAGAAGNGFIVTPVAENTLEISTTYQTYGSKIITFTTSQGYTMSLVNAVAYDVDLDVKNVSGNQQNTFSNAYISYTLGTTLTITLSGAVMPSDTDIITFQIQFLLTAS